MNLMSTNQSRNSTGKRLPNIAILLPRILLLLTSVTVAFPRYCTSLKSLDGVAFWSRSCNGGKINNAVFRQQNNRYSVESVASNKMPSRLSSSTSSTDGSQRDEQVLLEPELLFPTHRPLLAIITETDACDTEEKMKHTYETVKKATSTGKVDLVSVRLSLPPRCDETGGENQFYDEVLERACRLTKQLVALSNVQKRENQSKKHDDNDRNVDTRPDSSFVVVCSSDLVSVAVDARANGVHVKEHHLNKLSDIVDQFEYPIVVGTSTHSVESALGSYYNDDSDGTRKSTISRPKPHYYFVGTCYLTASHPEKTLQSQLEGPELPGRVKQALQDKFESMQLEGESSIDKVHKNTMSEVSLPRIMAIGGIDETNCHEPVALGADGVAVIRAVLQADHPIDRVEEMQAAMHRSYAQK